MQDKPTCKFCGQEIEEGTKHSRWDKTTCQIVQQFPKCGYCDQEIIPETEHVPNLLYKGRCDVKVKLNSSPLPTKDSLCAYCRYELIPGELHYPTNDACLVVVQRPDHTYYLKGTQIYDYLSNTSSTNAKPSKPASQTSEGQGKFAKEQNRPYDAIMSQSEYLQRFQEFTQKMIATTKAKNGDYAENFDAFANFRVIEQITGGRVSVEVGILTRLSDKLKRIGALISRPGLVKTESLLDTVSDLAVYSVILYLWLQFEDYKKSGGEKERIDRLERMNEAKANDQ